MDAKGGRVDAGLQGLSVPWETNMEYGYESSLALQDLDNPGDASRGEGASASQVCLPRACLSL